MFSKHLSGQFRRLPKTARSPQRVVPALSFQPRSSSSSAVVHKASFQMFLCLQSIIDRNQAISKIKLLPPTSGDTARREVITHLLQYHNLRFPQRVQKSSDLLTAQEEYTLQQKGRHPYVRECIEKKRISSGPKYSLEKFLKDSSIGWGWTIVRCTYQSQAQWEKFLALLLEDLDFELRHPSDEISRDAFYCQIIEDPSLDAASWKEARDTFDQWALTEMRIKSPPIYTKIRPLEQSIDQQHLEGRIHSSPRWQAFVYADQESVDSVTTSERFWKSKEQGGGYFINIVTTGNAPFGVFAIDEDGVWLKDYESQAVDRQTLRQRVKGCRLLELHEKMLGNLWPDRKFVNDDGITELP